MARSSFWVSLRDEEFELIKNNHLVKKKFNHPMFYKGRLLVVLGNKNTIDTSDLSDFHNCKSKGDTVVIRLPNEKIDKLLKHRTSALEFTSIPGTIIMLTSVDGFSHYTYSRLVN